MERLSTRVADLEGVEITVYKLDQKLIQRYTGGASLVKLRECPFSDTSALLCYIAKTIGELSKLH